MAMALVCSALPISRILVPVAVSQRYRPSFSPRPATTLPSGENAMAGLKNDLGVARDVAFHSSLPLLTSQAPIGIFHPATPSVLESGENFRATTLLFLSTSNDDSCLPEETCQMPTRPVRPGVS